MDAITRMSKNCLRPVAYAAVLATCLSCGTTNRGPVDRSLDAAHATHRTIGQTADETTDGPKSAVGSALSFPIRIVSRVSEALFGP